MSIGEVAEGDENIADATPDARLAYAVRAAMRDLIHEVTRARRAGLVVELTTSSAAWPEPVDDLQISRIL